jgi:hypothetical protein
VKVTEARFGLVGYARRASAIVLASLLMLVSGLFPTPALAITRGDVLARAHSWVAKRVMYSQSSSHGGYRRDCSGFVSMAWRLSTSYTSRTISAVAKRIPISQLRAGDAVHIPGHVTLFVAWKNKAKRTYVAMEEAQSGMPALHHVLTMERGATALRYRRIIDPPPVIAVTAPSTDSTSVVGIASASTPTTGPLTWTYVSGGLLGASASVETSTPVYQTGVLSSIQVSTLSDPSRMTGYMGGGYRFSLWS